MHVDLERLNIINQMTCDQKDFFLMGMAYHDAHLTKAELGMGCRPNPADVRSMQHCIDAMDRQGIRGWLNERQANQRDADEAEARFDVEEIGCE